jgi:Pyruvate/2-oxoacid:ferredoxin oxidoreductase gamma subunit
MKEIRIHGRGGQGVVLASEIFVNAAVKEGKHAACVDDRP